MSKQPTYVFILWGDDFEETPATIFVTELREAGLRVKVVGLTPQRINGAHGLALLPDLSLDQALPLAAQTICLIIPATAAGLKRLTNDPRLPDLCHRAQANQAKFIIGPLNPTDLTASDLFPPTADVITYPASETLIPFARDVAGRLAMPA